jgi:hypothetical protein
MERTRNSYESAFFKYEGKGRGDLAICDSMVYLSWCYTFVWRLLSGLIELRMRSGCGIGGGGGSILNQ